MAASIDANQVRTAASLFAQSEPNTPGCAVGAPKPSGC
jgi:hypothetical protein